VSPFQSREAAAQFFAHGYGIRSDFPIGELAVAPPDAVPSAASAIITLRRVERRRLPVTTPRDWFVRDVGGLSVARCEGGLQMASYCGSAAFVPDDGQGAVLHVCRGSHISTSRFNHTVLHSFLPQLLALRGETMLHATSVVIAGRVYVFAGASGMGKSTLAAGFAALGLPVFSEDVVRVAHRDGGALLAWPSYPGARLRSNSFLLPDDKRSDVGGRFGLPKHRVYVGVSTAEHPPAPLAGVFFLRAGRSVSPRFTRLTPMQAIKPLLKSCFIQALPKATRGREAFVRATGVAMAVPSFELRYRRSAAHFEALVAALVRDAVALA